MKTKNFSDNYNKILPTRLRELINCSNTTIAAVAESVGVTRQAVSQYQNGSTQPNAETLAKIAKHFNISADYLLGLSNEIKIKQCENCGKLFRPTKADEKYCSRIIDGVSCKQDASRKVRRETLAKKPHQKQYNSINTMLAYKLKRKNLTEAEKAQYKNELADFRLKALCLRNEVVKGNKTIEDYVNFLNSFKKGYKK